MKKLIFAFIPIILNFFAFSQVYIDFTEFEDYDPESLLAITSYIHDSNDCGEFGGHKESILIARYDSVWTCTFIRYPTQCPSKYKEKIVIEDTLNNNDLNNIKHFLKKLNQMSEPPWISNAPDSYEVRLSTRKKIFSYKIDRTSNRDIRKEYLSFRNKLIYN